MGGALPAGLAGAAASLAALLPAVPGGPELPEAAALVQGLSGPERERAGGIASRLSRSVLAKMEARLQLL